MSYHFARSPQTIEWPKRLYRVVKILVVAFCLGSTVRSWKEDDLALLEEVFAYIAMGLCSIAIGDEILAVVPSLPRPYFAAGSPWPLLIDSFLLLVGFVLQIAPTIGKEWNAAWYIAGWIALGADFLEWCKLLLKYANQQVAKKEKEEGVRMEKLTRVGRMEDGRRRRMASPE